LIVAVDRPPFAAMQIDHIARLERLGRRIFKRLERKKNGQELARHQIAFWARHGRWADNESVPL